MSDVTLDLDAMPQLRDAQEYLKVRDSSGRVVGYFLPAYQTATQVVFCAKSPLSPQERERLVREEGPSARPLSAFWEDLKRKYPNEFKRNCQ